MVPGTFHGRTMGAPGDGPMGAPGDGAGDGATDVAGEWVSISEAARRCGVSRRAIRGRIDRGTLMARDGNAGRAVFVPHGTVPRDVTDGSMDTPWGDDMGVPWDGPARKLWQELDQERERRAAAEIRAAVAEREVTLLRERVTELSETLKLALDRPPWWVRWARAMRSAGEHQASTSSGRPATSTASSG